MRLRKLILGLAALAAAAVGTTAANAQRYDRDSGYRGESSRGGGWFPWGKKSGGWELLGTQTVDFGVDRDVIRVGREDGRFTAIRLRVRNSDVHLMDLKVIYGDNEVDHIAVDRLIRADSDTGPLDLKGRERFIKEIQLVYRSRPDRRGGHAVVEVFGLHADGRGGPGPGRPVAAPSQQWELLGERAVEFKTDRDVIQVGRREGRFSKIKLKVRRHDIDLLALRIVYTNGQEDEYRIDRRVRDEEDGVTFDLRGARRSIERVVVIAKTRLNLGGNAVIQIYGLQ